MSTLNNGQTRQAAPTAATMLASMERSIITTADLDRLDIPPKKRMLGKWLFDSDLGIIYAPRGLGKTWMVNAIAKGLANGTAVGEWEAGESPSRVLIVDGEMALSDTRDRGRALSMASRNLHILHHERYFAETEQSLNIADRRCQVAILKLVEIHRYNVLFLDNLSTLASGVSENDADSWEMINPWLLELRRLKVSTVLVAHANRAGGIRGTSRREDVVNWILALKEDIRQDPDAKKGARFKSVFEKCRGVTEAPPPLTWEFLARPDGGTDVTCEEYSGRDYMLQLIEEGITNNKDLAEELGVSKSTVSKWASKMEKDGRIQKEARGNYRVIRP